MPINDIKAHLLGLEKQYWQAIKNRDGEAAKRLTHESCLLAGPRGVKRVDAETFGLAMNKTSYTLQHFSLDEDAHVCMVRDDVAVLAYKVREELIVDGRYVVLHANDASTWVRCDGRWLCALHTEAIAGDPFGRDRAAAAS